MAYRGSSLTPVCNIIGRARGTYGCDLRICKIYVCLRTFPQENWFFVTHRASTNILIVRFPKFPCLYVISSFRDIFIPFYGPIYDMTHSPLPNRKEALDSPYLSEQAEDLSSQILSEEFWRKFVSLYVQEGHTHDTYLPSLMNFFYRLFKMFHAQLFGPTRSSFTSLCSSKDISEQRLASEWFAGLLKSTKSWTLLEIRDLKNDMQSILDTIIDYIGPYSLGNWLVAFEDGTVRHDYSRSVVEIEVYMIIHVFFLFFCFL